MEIIVIFEPQNQEGSITPHAGCLHINCGDSQSHSVELKFSYDDLWNFTKDTESSAFDFLLLAHIVYCIDRAIARKKFSTEGWTRYIRVVNIPIQNVSLFMQAKIKLQNAINFLTGDNWEFEFANASPIQYRSSIKGKYDCSDYAKISLFSGGLDSLIGFVNEASSLPESKKILLISHKELGKEGGDQSRILKKCEELDFFSVQYTQLQLNAGLKQGSWKNKLPTENTFRSRSLLFIAAGIYCAQAIPGNIPLIIPENGTISLNIPLEKGRRGACSTRTTHPTFLTRLSEALRILGITTPLENPYKYKTKADMMVEACSNARKNLILQHLTHLSCSCAKRSHNRYWDKRGGEVRHCGCCLPCVYRRVALDAVVMDDMKYIGTDIYLSNKFDLNNHTQQRSSDIRSLLYFLKHNCNRQYIAQELLLNGIRNLDDINKYTELALRSYEQVKKWLNKLDHDRYTLSF